MKFYIDFRLCYSIRSNNNEDKIINVLLTMLLLMILVKYDISDSSLSIVLYYSFVLKDVNFSAHLLCLQVLPTTDSPTSPLLLLFFVIESLHRLRYRLLRVLHYSFFVFLNDHFVYVRNKK